MTYQNISFVKTREIDVKILKCGKRIYRNPYWSTFLFPYNTYEYPFFVCPYCGEGLWVRHFKYISLKTEL